jgi:hypothetical protein
LVPLVVGGVAAVVAINALFELAENISKLAKILRQPTEDIAADFVPRLPGERSLEAIVKIARSSNSHFRLEEWNDEQSIVLELTPSEAREAPAKLRTIRSRRRLYASGDPLLPGAASFFGQTELGPLVEAIGQEHPGRLREVMETLFALLNRRPEGVRIIGDMINGLRREGHNHAADILADLAAQKA